MFKIFCITDRKNCCEDFLTRIEKIAAAKPDRILLREKDLPADDYILLARQVLPICQAYHVPCSFYQPVDFHEDFHVSLATLEQFRLIQNHCSMIGASIHSLADAAAAEKQQVNYMIAGHIFPTGCKPDLPPRGLDFLKAVCSSTAIPVYAIGGIQKENIAAVAECGAAGACIMSGFMTCHEPKQYLHALRNEVTVCNFDPKC